jgi:Tn3 transposase DDE domain
MVEGVIHHSTEMEVDRQYVDSHGQSTVAFAFCRLLGFQLLPRLKAIPRELPYGRGDVLLIVSPEEAVFQCAVRRFVNELNGIRRDRHYGNNGHERGRLNALQTVTGLYVFDSHQGCFFFLLRHGVTRYTHDSPSS